MPKILRDSSAVKEVENADIQSDTTDTMDTTEIPVEFINTGCTVLNLAISNKGRDGGWPRGRIINVVGDGSSGKTALALEACAYVFHNMVGNVSKNFPKVKRVKIVYDNAEGVMDFPIIEMYGREFYESVEWAHSESIQAFGRRFAKEVDQNKPGEMLFYVLDSIDSTNTEESAERFDDASKKDKAEDSSYGAGAEKAHYLSDSFFPNIDSKMRGKDVTLFLVSQIREKIGVTFGKKYKRNGGKALDFYTHVVVWLYEIEQMKRQAYSQQRPIGIRTLAKVERNKVAKPFREAEIQILFDYGVDDISSCLAYLYGPKVEKINWDGDKDAAGLSRADTIKKIEAEGLQGELAKRVEELWRKVERAIAPDRAKRYS